MKHYWKLYTPGLIREIASNSGQAIYKIPLNMLRMGLFEIAERATELNDPDLNALMLQMGLYAQGDPESKEYDCKLVERSIMQRIARRKKAKQLETKPEIPHKGARETRFTSRRNAFGP